MLPCNTKNCAYKQRIPGNTHTRCIFKWSNGEFTPPTNQASSKQNKWFIFPLNYDPVWGPDDCPALSNEMDKDKVEDSSPLLDLLSVLGNR